MKIKNKSSCYRSPYKIRVLIKKKFCRWCKKHTVHKEVKK
ncbi:50S ribosomal protein L33 [Patescibacteria group bacterium]|nr:50S ribosomal protein L33 [Patescibacteria group bacterium]MBU2578193.1 50S ribosomal protein L33 [Patescibacteria group bacterium]